MSEFVPVGASRKLAHDWYEGAIPDNVTFDSSNYIDTSYSFRRFRSRRKEALILGHGAAVYTNTTFDLGPQARVAIGAFAMLNGAEIICDGSVDIGDYSLISWNVVLIDNYRAPRSVAKRRAYIGALIKDDPCAELLQQRPQPIVIGGNVWIGHDCVVLPGVSIGEGSVIGARSVVAEAVPAFAVAAGNPARVIRRIERPG
jgi:acetyltransferase-like isoleucine patch superfamily enzyme